MKDRNAGKEIKPQRQARKAINAGKEWHNAGKERHKGRQGMAQTQARKGTKEEGKIQRQVKV